MSTSHYEFARSSTVPNAGEDFANAARHRHNAWRSLQQAEADGIAEHLITRDNLLKYEPPQFEQTLTEDTALSHLAAFLVLKSFPPKPCSDRNIAIAQRAALRRQQRDPDSPAPKTPAEYRHQYYSTYCQLKMLLEAQAQQSNAWQVLQTACFWIGQKIVTLRIGDVFNPVANTLVPFQKKVQVKLSHRHYRSTDVGAKINTFLEQMSADSSIQSQVLAILAGKATNSSKPPIPKFNETEQYVTMAKRQGGRSFANYDVELLLNHFGLRGIQFGNSVPDRERRLHLKEAADAFADLADVTGLSDQQVSLNQMGLAIGARGRQALAHYEPNLHVTNLSRTGGIGALAHEWGHAWDHSLTKRTIIETTEKPRALFLSEFCDRNLDHTQMPFKVDPEVFAAMQAAMTALQSSGYNDRLRKLLREKRINREISEAREIYFRKASERFARAFERFVAFKLQQHNRINSYLAGVQAHPIWVTNEELQEIAPQLEVLLSSYRKQRLCCMIRETVRST
ncbi:LPD1 domain-containing protein [Leptolyngbya sp. AN03gr2]|uniref:LPD1 domain-containing protein n=1 Tax=unclassified Leptolyngbya TaxID=2650499 RepID=UPI003D31DCF7